MSLNFLRTVSKNDKICKRSVICCMPKEVKSMIEIVYKTEQQKAEGNEGIFKIPNNIRQIGEWKGHQKIYIEDYAYTFLKKISRGSDEGGKAAILLGSHHWAEECSYLFIKSALQIQDMEVSPEHIVFSDKIWGQIYEDTKKYFEGQEIVGWFVSLPGFNMQINENLLKTHLNHFAGNEKTLFLVEPGEWEEAFFMYENNQLIRQPGYYIYYEKNDAMQSYMIQMSQNKSIEETEKIPDRAVADFRKTVKDKAKKVEKSEQKKVKKEQQPTELKEKKDSRIGWMAGACAAVAVFAVAFIQLNQQRDNFESSQEITENQKVAQEASSDNLEVFDDSTKLEENTNEKKQENTWGKEWKESEENKDIKQSEITGDDQEKQSESDQEEKKPEQEEKEPEQPATQTTGNSVVKTEEYIIKRGDTMISICKNKYGNIDRLEEVCQLNGITSEDLIYAGKKLLLPD